MPASNNGAGIFLRSPCPALLALSAHIPCLSEPLDGQCRRRPGRLQRSARSKRIRLSGQPLAKNQKVGSPSQSEARRLPRASQGRDGRFDVDRLSIRRTAPSL